MTDPDPATCSLGAGALEERLAAIAEVGADSLVSHRVEGGRHLLRFRAEARTLRRLEQIQAAEAECCPVLELSLDRRGDELVLAIAAPRQAQALADGLAGAFGGLDLL